MNRNIYALLVGIDDYVDPVPPLFGCVNDIQAVKAYLEGRVAKEGYQLHLSTLLNEKATRQSIIDGFRQHLCQAGPDDVAFFYYAGHGSQEDSPEAFWAVEPDHLDETLVCYDSRSNGVWDLADKELGKLIAEIDQKSPHIAIILDCCHSGSLTRGNFKSEMAVRKAPIDRRKRPIDSFIFSVDEIEQLSPKARSLESNPSGWTFPKGKHIVLSACHDSETAKEYNGAGERRGAFSYFLLDTLQKANGSLTYRDLFKRADALVRAKLTDQSPQIESTDLKDLDQPFLGGAIASSTPYFTVSYNKDHGWVIDGGAIHGIPQPVEDQTTLLALFPFDSSPEQLRQLQQKIGSVEVSKILPQLSQVKISGIDPNQDTTFKAVITSLPILPKGIFITGETEGTELARTALQKNGPAQQPSLYLCEVATVDKAEFKLLARGGQFLIARPADDRLLVNQIQGYTDAKAVDAIQWLEHIARWTNIAELSSPANSRIQTDAVQMTIIQKGQELQASQIRLEYQLENDKWKKPTFKLKLINTSNQKLYCALLVLTDSYAVTTAELLPGGGVWLNPKEEAWALRGEPIPTDVSDKLWKQGITETKDFLKLIVSTAEFDAKLLEQAELGSPPSAVRSVSRGHGTLNLLMQRVQTRGINSQPEAEELCDDWVSSQVTFTTVRPLTATAVPNVGSGISLGSGVTLQAHPGLKAQARLTTVTQSTRDLGNLILPPLLREDSTASQPFQFTTSRGSDPGLSALELNQVDAETIGTVTSQQPLKLTVDTLLDKGERVLAFAHDGEFFLPLGMGQTMAGKTEIVLERLPDPVSEGQRSLTRAIRIFFQKVVSEKLGSAFPYPILSAVQVNQDGTIEELKDIKERVAKAKRMVLFIHGIIGETKGMVPSMQSARTTVKGQPAALNDCYDLVLTFDYESLATSIEAHAQSLKQRLADVGLGQNHGKVLHIIAHSMGGLVSRWFIEREGGNAIVNHLIMLGTPNGGSPWATVQAWATSALAIGLNSFAPYALPLIALGSLVAAIEPIDKTLRQMQPKSKLLNDLAASPDPHIPYIPYTILAGNTSIIPADMDMNRLERLMQKLKSDAVAMPFFRKDNDIAATVESIKQVPGGRTPQPQVQEVGCNHLVYFTNPEGLNALASAVAQALSH